MTKLTYKFAINDMVLVKDALVKGTTTKCQVIDRGFDEEDIAWYTCIPIEFNCPVGREFSEDRLTLIHE